MGSAGVASVELCNGLPVDSSQRQMAFGDGVFETIFVHRGAPHLFESHCQRLQQGLFRLGIELDLQLIYADFASLIKSISEKVTYRVRLTVARVGHYDGYSTKQCGLLRHIIALPYQYENRADNISLCLSSVRLGLQPKLAGIKHCCRLEQILAKRELRANDCDEALMLDANGEVIEAIAANIVVIKNELLLTPVLDKCGVNGVMRSFLLQKIAPRVGLNTQEKPLSIEDIMDCDGLALTNSLGGLRIVSTFDPTVIKGNDSGEPAAVQGVKHWLRHPKLEQCQLMIRDSMLHASA